MAMSRSFRYRSDEVREKASDFCCICANYDEIQPASYFCFECGIFGRYLCSTCFRSHNFFVSKHEVAKIENQSNSRIQEKDKKIKILEEEKIKLLAEKELMKTERDGRHRMACELEQKVMQTNDENCKLKVQIQQLLVQKNILNEELTKTAKEIEQLTTEKAALEENFEKLRKYMEKASRDNQRMLDDLIGDNQKEMRSLNNKLIEVIKERDDLKTRLSKLAVPNLTDAKLVDIPDLSDPNRAMKVSEMFDQLHDDEWTDAFEELKTKMGGKDAIQILLHFLQDCHTFCNKVKEAQIDSLNNVFLNPSQDVTQFANEHRKNVGELKQIPRISYRDEKAVRNLRRQIGVSNACIEEVKQAFVLETKSWIYRGYDKKQMEVCKPYLERCAEVCWLMVLHDPPLFMKIDALHGDKMDPNLYTVYTTSGDKIDYLVWPPLYYNVGGCIIKKGIAECLRNINKE